VLFRLNKNNKTLFYFRSGKSGADYEPWFMLLKSEAMKSNSGLGAIRTESGLILKIHAL